jgi:hypothetical protein
MLVVEVQVHEPVFVFLVRQWCLSWRSRSMNLCLCFLSGSGAHTCTAFA